MDWHVYGQMDRQGDRQTDNQVNRSKCHLFKSFQWNKLLSLYALSTSSTSLSSRPRSNARETLKRAALRLVRCGELSRAAKLLTSPGLAPASPEVASKLAAKHPARVKEIPNQANLPLPEPIDLSSLLFFTTISKLPRGLGSGPSGWKFEHFRALVSKSTSAEMFFSVCNLVAKGSMPDVAAKLLSAARLIAIPKPNGDVRPIAVGECLR
jgi:hypothetical protein